MMSSSACTTLNSSAFASKLHLNWASHRSPLFTKLSFNVVREICSYLGEETVVAVLSSQMKFLSVTEPHWQRTVQLSRKINATRYSSSTFLEGSDVFVCGGGLPYVEDKKPYDTAYILGDTGTVNQQGNMRTGRIAPGIIYIPLLHAVYVFGGANEHRMGMKTTEKYQLDSSRWESLRDMQFDRAYFNPCTYSSEVYLCGGGRGNHLIEIYYLFSNSFSILPDFTLHRSEQCMAVMEAESLVIVSTDAIYQLDLQKGTVAQTNNKLPCAPYSSCTPKMLEGVLYFVNLTRNECFGVKLASGDVEQSMQFQEGRLVMG